MMTLLALAVADASPLKFGLIEPSWTLLFQVLNTLFLIGLIGGIAYLLLLSPSRMRKMDIKMKELESQLLQLKNEHQDLKNKYQDLSNKHQDLTNREF